MNVVLVDGPRDGARWHDVSDDAVTIGVALVDQIVWREGETEARAPIARYIATGADDDEGYRMFRWQSTSPANDESAPSRS